jgi:2-desacetyl-2-hydroxyethyl bacteriochlorophyllide A dehydrogenase
VKAVALTAPERFQVIDLPDVTDDPDQALVGVESVGVCGTDVSIFHGKIPVTYPRVLGHEVIGRVRRAGRRNLVPEGTRVLINPSIACGACHACRADNGHLCPNGALIGRDVDGGFADLVAADESRLLAVPEQLSPAEASLLQVAGTCVHAQQSFRAFPGQTAVVIGLGVAGCIMLQLLNARGVTEVLGVTRSRGKARLVERFSPARVVVPEDAEAACADMTGGRGADVVIEAAGTLATLGQAVRLAGLAATVVLFGTIGQPAQPAESLPFYDLYYKELTIRNPRAARHRDYQVAIDLAAAGRLGLGQLWSQGFALEAAAQALAATQDPAQLKITLAPAAAGDERIDATA